MPKYDFSGVDSLPAAPAAPASKYDFSSVDALPAAPGFDKSTALFNAAFGNPSEEAERRRVESDIARITGGFQPVLDLKEGLRRQQALEADHVTRASPRTSAFLSEAQNAAVAIQDAKTMAQIEKAWNTPGRIIGGRGLAEFTGDVALGAAVGGVALGEAAVGIADIGTGNAVGNVLGYLGYDPKGVKDFIKSYQSPQLQAADEAVQKADGFSATLGAVYDNPMAALSTVIESGAMTAGGAAAARYVAMRALAAANAEVGTAAATAVLKDPMVIRRMLAAASIAEGAMTAGSIQEQARQAGRDWSQAVVPAVVGGAITGLISRGTSMIPGFRDAEVTAAAAGLGATSRIPVLAFAREGVKSTFKEGVLEEMPQSWQEQIATNFALGKPWDEGLGNAAAMGLVAGAGQAGGMHVFTGAREGVSFALAQREEANRVKQQAELLQHIFEQTKNIKSDPVTFKSFMDGVTDNATVFVNADDLQQVLAQNNMGIEVLPTAAEMLAQGPSVTGDVEIPVGELMTAFAGTPAQEQIVQHTRVRQDDLSQAQWEQMGDIGAFLKSQTKEVQERQAKNEQFQSELDDIEKQFTGQLPGVPNIDRLQHSNRDLALYGRMVRDFYAVGADFMKMTPKQLAEIVQLKFPGAEQVPAGPSLTQGFDHGKPMVNIGLDIGDQQNALSKEDAIAMLQKLGVTVTDSNVVNLTHDWGKENTLIAHLDKPLTPEQMTQLMADTQQEAIPQYTGGIGTLYHATPEAAAKWGSFNPEYFRDLQGVSLLDAQKVLEQKKGAAKKKPSKAKPVPEGTAEAANITNANKIAATGKFDYIRDLKEQIQNAVRAAAQGVDLSATTPEVRKYLTDLGTQEALAALQTNSNAVGWYDEKTRQALSVVALVHPEILTDPDARFTFIYALAVTSNGQRVEKNFELAERAYAGWKESKGVMPSDVGAGGPAGGKVHEALARYNDLVAKFGSPAEVEKFMLTEFTSKELAEAGFKKSGENVDTVVLGAAILGPKIGNGFFANLYGVFDRLTMDRWLMRTWGRWTGTLLQDNRAAVADEKRALKALVRAVRADKEANAAMRQVFAMSVKGVVDKSLLTAKASPWEALVKSGNIEHIGDQLHLKSTYPSLRAVMKSSVLLDELRKSGNRLYNKLDGSNEAPGGGKQRNWIRAVFNDILQNVVESTGQKMEMADLQALLWYPEKRLYDSAKSDDELQGYEDDEAPDYANAAVALARSKGISGDAIAAALANPADRPAVVRPVAGGAVARELGSFTDGAEGAVGEAQDGELAQAVRSAGAVAGPVVGIHYSQQPRASLASSAFGSGMPGAERERLAASKDPRIKQRVAFYVNTGSGIFPESGVGSNAHVATLRNLYDADADALKIWRNAGQDMNAAESAVLDAGFDGYLTRSFGRQGTVVMLGSRSVDVQSVKREDVSTVAGQPPSAEIPKMKQAAMAILQNTKLPFGQQSVESWKRDLERTDPDTASLIDWAAIPPGDYYKDQIAARLWQNDTWYFSALSRAVENAPAKVFGSGKAVAQWLQANAGKLSVKKEEVEATGILDWLDTQPKITKENVVDFLKKGGVQIQEVVLGTQDPAAVEASRLANIAEAKARAESQKAKDALINALNTTQLNSANAGFWVYDIAMREIAPEMEGRAGMAENAEAKLLPLVDKAGAQLEYDLAITVEKAWIKASKAAQDAHLRAAGQRGKFEQWQLPGGEPGTYRELLITLPPSTALPEGFKLKQRRPGYWIVDGPGPLDENQYGSGATPEQALQSFAAYGHGRDKVFKSSHFPDTPNILAHVRTNMRTGANGKRVLFIEEIQSDWAQKGRKEGFQNDDARDELAQETTGKNYADLPTYLQRVVDDRLSQRVPNAPFVTDTKSWTALALKRMIAYAVEQGADSIAWTTGEQQAARYDLSKQVESIDYTKTDKGYYINVTANGTNVKNGDFTTSELEDIVGKEVVKKMERTEGTHLGDKLGDEDLKGTYELRGLDLKVGGEGMKGYYDGIVPQVANDVLKKIGGGRVTTVRIVTQDAGTTTTEAEDLDAEIDAIANAAFGDEGTPARGATASIMQQPGFEITDAMREAVGSGLPLFARDEQQRRGSFNPLSFELRLTEHANRTTLIHELSHFFMAAYIEMAQQPNAPAELTEFVENLLGYLFKTVSGGEQAGGAEMGQKVGAGGTAYKAVDINSPEFKRWFGDSKVVDDQGRPLVVYHWTDNDFSEFDMSMSGEGAHFGTKKSATDRARGMADIGYEIEEEDGQYFVVADSGPKADEWQGPFATKKEAISFRAQQPKKIEPMALYLNITNPIRLPDLGTWSAWDIVRALPNGTLSESDRAAIMDADDRYAKLRETLLNKGIDGVVYRNEVEDKGHDSYIAFEPSQIKSAISNTGAFDPTKPSILEQGGDTAQPGPLPAGRSNIERWNAMTLDQQRPYWEHFAEQWEQYAMTGKAPTKALQTAFSAFAKWMKSVYQSFKNFLLQNPQAKPLDPEITQYFDRMLATEAELEAAREERGYKALFKAAADAGMSPSQFADYMALDELQKTEANELLLSRSLRDMKWLSNAKSKAIKEIQAEADELRALVRAGVEEELADTPIRKAERWLRKGEMVQDGEQIKATAGFKLNAEIVKAMFPQGAVDSVDLAKLKQMMSSTGTQHPDDVAAIFGFRNGETMVRELLELQPFKDEAQQLTDLRMLEEHGDLATPEAIEKAADAAIHNAAHLKMVATEVWALNNRVGSVAALTKAAKEFAKNLIGNTTVKKLSPSSYANAATRAGKMASRAVAKKETDVAAREKRMEMINAAAAKEAYAAEAEVRAIMNRLRKIAAYSDKHSSVTSREFSVVQAVRAILGEFDIGSKVEKAQTYVATVSEYDPMLGARLKEVIDTLTASPKPWAELTVDELRELHAEIGGLWTVAREIRTVELAGEKMTLDEARQQLLDKLSENRKAGKDGKAFSLTDAEIRSQDFMSFVARGVRPESWISMKDGNEQYGPWRRLIWNAIDRAQLGYNADKADKLKQLKALLETVAADMKDVQIDAPELGGTFGAGNVIGYSELLHAILHTGNESNKTKLLVGRGWGGIREDGTLDSTKWDAFMKRMWAEGKITAKHMKFVQGVWDLMESMKEGAQKAHRATTGRYFDEIQATEIVTPFGTYRGGYVPAIVDRRLVADADVRKALEESQTDVLQTFEKPAGGFTKSRVKNYNSKLELNIAALGRHIDQVMLFTHMSVPVRNVQRVLRGPALSKELSEQDRSALTKVIMPWLHGAATQTVTERGSMSYENLELLTKARSRAGAALMFANISNSVQQLTGFFPALLKTDSKELLFAAAKGWYKPRELAAHVSELSPYMKQRMDSEVHAMAEEIDHILLNPTRFEKAQDWAIAHSYFLQMAVDSAMSPVIWQAKFNETVARGGSQQEAIDLADSAVRMTQGSNRAIDIAAMERGSPFYRLFMQFAGYFNTQINLVGEKLAAAKTLPSVPVKYGRIGMVLWLGWLAPAIASALVVQLFRGGVDDDDKDGEWLDDWLVSTLIGAPFKYAAAAVPVFGQTIVAAMNSFNDKPYDDRISMSPAVSLVEGGFRGGKALIGAFEDPTKAGRAIRDIGTFMSLFTGVPITPVTKAVGYATDAETGKIAPTGPVDYGRGIITGTASPESKR